MAAKAKKTTSGKRAPSKPSKSVVKDSLSTSDTMAMPVFESSQKQKASRKNILLLAGVAVILGLLYYYKELFVVATVNGKPITRIEVISELEKQNGKGVVDNLVTKSLIIEEASKKNIVVTGDDVNNELSKIEEDLKAQGQTLDQVLTMQGLKRADVEENLRIKIYIEKILDEQTKVSDEMIQKYFDENKATYPKDTKFEDQKDAIAGQLKQQKLQEEYQKWIDELKGNAKINYFKTY